MRNINNMAAQHLINFIISIIGSNRRGRMTTLKNVQK
jgi:hypothetical protein